MWASLRGGEGGEGGGIGCLISVVCAPIRFLSPILAMSELHVQVLGCHQALEHGPGADSRLGRAA